MPDWGRDFAGGLGYQTRMLDEWRKVTRIEKWAYAAIFVIGMAGISYGGYLIDLMEGRY